MLRLALGVVQDSYPGSEAKVALALAVGQSAKRHLVEEFGIGEELQMNLFGWVGDDLGVIAQYDQSWGDNEDQHERLERLEFVAQAMRRAWGCDSFTLLSEAFVSQKPDRTKDRELASEFASGSTDVTECLSIIHVEDEDDVHICAQTYEIAVGKKIEFAEILHTDNPELLRNNEFCDALVEMLNAGVVEESEDWARLRLEFSMTVADCAGWFIQHDL